MTAVCDVLLYDWWNLGGWAGWCRKCRAWVPDGRIEPGRGVSRSDMVRWALAHSDVVYDTTLKSFSGDGYIRVVAP